MDKTFMFFTAIIAYSLSSNLSVKEIAEDSFSKEEIRIACAKQGIDNFEFQLFWKLIDKEEQK